MTKVIIHATRSDAERRSAAIDKAMGYPKQATKRGANCPPAPFGRTEVYSRPEQNEDGDWTSAEAPSRVVGSDVVVDGETVRIDNVGLREADGTVVDAEPVIARTR